MELIKRIVIPGVERPTVSEVLIGRGLPSPLLAPREDRGMAVVVSQPGAASFAARVAELIGAEVIEVPDREQAKTLAVAESLYGRLASIDLGRRDTLVGVGGGAVTDLAGFVAATWLRGVEAVLVPTTLLAAVDAAIGGKTGVNFAGKNLVGAFHLPTRVVIDVEVLESLPLPLRLEGLAEALKAGLVGDPQLVELLASQGGTAPLDEVVARSVAVKASVVAGDLYEAGRRAILNYGHTIGHAVENVSGIPHGLAVAVGMVAAGTISALRYGFPHHWQNDVIFSLGLPVAANGISARAVKDMVQRDKKRSGTGIRMVLLRGIADPVVVDVTEDELHRGLAAVGIG
ncbi:MAG: 3-dehydroquinate synthase [Actinomycetota bacterium]